MSISLLVACLVIPVAVLFVDLGRRRLTLFRLLRPVLFTALVVPFVMPGFAFGGDGLWLEVAGVVAGVLLGVLAAVTMRVEASGDADGRPVTVAGAPYAVVWLLVAGARLWFTWASSHSVGFQRDLGEFLVTHHIAVNALADAVMFTGFAMLLVQRGSLWLRARGTVTARAAAPVGVSSA
ncbi:hypothetical protein [Phaeacidiphilus oryzae]|uniref:hypothetical protein n=1 Tax=Phaeacidiphilus oryzae TaxID=348818 RepID=UPI00056014A9|nr:hypothetical protein [Phaeacidiphilus oryzae]